MKCKVFGLGIFLTQMAMAATEYEFNCSLIQTSNGQTLSTGQVKASTETPVQELNLTNGTIHNKVQIELAQDLTYKMTITTNQNKKNSLEYKTSLNNLQKNWSSLQSFPTALQNSSDAVLTSCEGRQL